MNAVKIIGSVAAGGTVGAGGVMLARMVMPKFLGMVGKIPFIGPKVAMSPGAQQFLSDAVVALAAAPGVVLGHALIRTKNPTASVKEAIKSVTA